MTKGAEKRLQRPYFQTVTRSAGPLAEMQLITASLAQFSLGGRAGLTMRGPPFFFLVLQGQCRLGPRSGGSTLLNAGDAVLSLHGQPLNLSADADAAAFGDIAEVWRANSAPAVSYDGYDGPVDIRWGEGKVRCRLLGCAMTLSRPMTLSAFYRAVPPLLRLAAADTGLGNWIAPLRRMMRREGLRPAAGFAESGTAMAQFLLTEQLRAWANGEDATDATIDGGERMTRIRKVMDRVRQEPAASWTFGSMARDAGMSRTGFNRYFSEAAGMTPFRFIASCRMDHAARLLRQRGLSVAEAARQSGYQSERAFRETFTRLFGVAPHAFRKAGLASTVSEARAAGQGVKRS